MNHIMRKLLLLTKTMWHTPILEIYCSKVQLFLVLLKALSKTSSTLVWNHLTDNSHCGSSHVLESRLLIAPCCEPTKNTPTVSTIPTSTPAVYFQQFQLVRFESEWFFIIFFFRAWFSGVRRGRLQMCGFFVIFKQTLLGWFGNVEDHAVWIGHKLSTNPLYGRCLASVVQLELQILSQSPSIGDRTTSVTSAVFVFFFVHSYSLVHSRLTSRFTRKDAFGALK